ncbi:aminotransferase class V-fold PLP-dependent enzyme [Spirosoma sp. KUDC1026]|uniref:aminotransferase class V-fold PLP-dependent enzyme n=1 Tax=Spirosoma sp. KUDC1026 TaxID=2745947 RepID=UPI00159BE6B2|nr:aminotransferase class V-fold PLP-dependent enzyme [Spirosoma sp. KUDC1026]QKZ13258.1 aminotransferase class V-fold PLP-dependent enzyme [Spirosoma sp. KUDC1026]
MKNLYFTPGPAELYPTFYQHLQTAMDEQLGSISHRSQRFRDIYKFTDEQLRILLNIPQTHGIFFTGSASEVWERMLFNCVEHESFHLVNGSFSRKFYDYANSLHKFAHILEKPFGEGFDSADVEIPEYAEVVCLTHNETSSGVQMRTTDMHKLKRKYPKKLFCVDTVSSAPYPDLDFGLIDSAFFSVQKAFGMPAGLGVWIAGKSCLEKAERLQRYESMTIGAHHTLPTLWKHYKTYETPATPNVLYIYILGKIAEDFNKIGIDTIRKQTEEKAKMLYKFLDDSGDYSPFVKEERHRSQTVVVADTKSSSADVIAAVKKAGLIIGSGYGSLKESQIRIANFPAVTVEQVATLIQELKK